MKQTLTEQFESCESDVDRWKLVIKHASKVSMMLDNDETSVSFDDGKNWRNFDGYIGTGEGPLALGEALGLKSCKQV